MAIYAQNQLPTILLLRGGYVEIQPGESRETNDAEIAAGVYVDAVLQGFVKIVTADSKPERLDVKAPVPVGAPKGQTLGQSADTGGMNDDQYKQFLAEKNGKAVPAAAPAEPAQAEAPQAFPEITPDSVPAEAETPAPVASKRATRNKAA